MNIKAKAIKAKAIKLVIIYIWYIQYDYSLLLVVKK